MLLQGISVILEPRFFVATFVVSDVHSQKTSNIADVCNSSFFCNLFRSRAWIWRCAYYSIIYPELLDTTVVVHNLFFPHNYREKNSPSLYNFYVYVFQLDLIFSRGFPFLQTLMRVFHTNVTLSTASVRLSSVNIRTCSILSFSRLRTVFTFLFPYFWEIACLSNNVIHVAG